MTNDWMGKILNRRYRLDSLRARGGMGAVFKGYDLSLAVDVAVKVLHPQYSEDPLFRSRFQQEAQVAARLRHPCIVSVRDLGEDPPHLYIVMEFIPGENLHELLTRLKAERQTLLLSDALELVRLICLALQYLHQQGIFHRDVKPGNIMLRPLPALGEAGPAGSVPVDPWFGALSLEPGRTYPLPYSPVLTDLGLAKLVGGTMHTVDGTSIGTPTYMSPEQARGERTDCRSDVYSTGVLLYELTTGQPPFPIQTLMQAVRFHTQETPAPPSSLRAEIQPQLEQLILTALAKSPEQRFQSAGAMAAALAQVLAATRSEATPGVAGQERSLLTLVQQTMIAPAEPRRDRPPAPGDPTRDQITCTAPDGTSRSIALEPAGLTIGRGTDNDLVLDDPRASRYHARITFDGANYAVTDLDSTNGTQLDLAKLLPKVSQAWAPGQVLRIGGYTFHLTRGVRPAPAPADRTVAIAPGMVLPVELVVETPDLSAEPGGSAVARVSVLNQSTRVDHFQVRAAGIPADWVPALPAPIYLLPGNRQQVALTIQPPRSPQSRAGPYPLTLQAFGQNDPNQVAQGKANLTVSPFYQFEADLRPLRQSGIDYGDFKLLLRNQGNTDLSPQLSASDAEEACLYAFEPAQPVLSPGQEAQVSLRVRARVPQTDQTPKAFPFRVAARPVQAPQLAREMQGEWVRTAPTFELGIRPQKQSSSGMGAFTVQVQNTCASPLTVELEAVDREEACHLTLEPAQVSVLPGEERQARLEVRARAPLAAQAPRTFCITVTGRPPGSPLLTRQVQAEWEQVPPSFELNMRPQKQSSAGTCFYTVQLQNTCNAPITLQLQAVDREEGCLLALEPPQVLVAPGQQAQVRLRVQPKAPLPALAPKTFYLTVTARPSDSPRLTRQVQAEWEQILPNFEVALNPPRLRRRGRAHFEVQVRNPSDIDLTVQLTAADPAGECLYTFDPAQLSIAKGSSGLATLSVRSRGAEPKGRVKPHPFTVTARPVQAPLLTRQGQAEWEQVPARQLGLINLLWILLVALAWCAAFSAGPLARDWVGYTFGDQLLWTLERQFGGEWVPFAERLLPRVSSGLVTGALGGLLTGLILCLAERRFRGRQLAAVTLGWALCWTVARAFLAFLPDLGLELSVAAWGVFGAATGLVGGWFTGRAVRSAQPGGSAFLIALGWAVAWAAAEVIGSMLLEQGSWQDWGHLGDTLGLFALTGLIAGAVGGLVTFLCLGRAQTSQGAQDALQPR